MELGYEPGLFVDGELEATWKVTTTEHMTADEARMRMAGLFDMLERDGRRAICDDAVIASVVPGLTDAWVTATRAYRPTPLVVGPGVKTGVKMRYNDPGELGADRVADLVAARTAIRRSSSWWIWARRRTSRWLTRAARSWAASLAPGVKLSAKALSDAAARLAMVDLKAPASVVGKNTREAMQAGVDGEVALSTASSTWYGANWATRPSVIATGSDAAAIAALSQRVARTDEHPHPAGPEHAAHVEPSLKINQGLQFNPVRVQFPPC
ncbi:MAG: type III pantothenate kinase [Eggerthella lenta]